MHKSNNIYKKKKRTLLIINHRFVVHCNNALRAFNLEFDANNKSLSLLSDLPKQFQEGFEGYRRQYHQRKKARQAKSKKQ